MGDAVQPLPRTLLSANRPCIIVAIRREDLHLAGPARRHLATACIRYWPGLFKAAKPCEQAVVAREVMEESCIKVKKSALCDFLCRGLLSAVVDDRFMAEYDSGEIVIDPKELLVPNWYRYDDPPLLPPPGTVARRLIEDTVAMCRLNMIDMLHWAHQR